MDYIIEIPSNGIYFKYQYCYYNIKNIWLNVQKCENPVLKVIYDLQGTIV